MNKKNQTHFVSKEQAVKDVKWFVFDAAGKNLGRFASEVAKILTGKHKPNYTPNTDTGDGVIIINADKIVVTGAKEAQKEYRHYTGYIGGMRAIPYRTMMEKHPERIIERAVSGMVPKTKLGNKQLKKLRVFAKADHKMQAQQPIVANI